MRKMYEKKYPRREGETLWRYNKRISNKMAQDMVKIVDAIQAVVDVITTLIKKVIPGIILGTMVVAFMYVCLVYGGDDQCTFVPKDNGYKAYTCTIHGDNCAEND